ncbi:MAG: hypothetical protein AAFN70_15115, partial [Planctomycetota bacterium]
HPTQTTFPLRSRRTASSPSVASFYVSCGSVRVIVSAGDARRAAVWMLHQVMRQVLPLGHVLSGAAIIQSSGQPADNADSPMRQLAQRIRVSKDSFDNGVSDEFSMIEILGQWHQMVAALDRLESDRLESDRLETEQLETAA